MQLLYVAGPMSGYPAYNYPAFESAAAQLRRMGYAVLSPTENKPDNPTWDNYMRASIAQVIAADGIAVLDNWQMSAGAALEVHIAHALRVPVLPLREWVNRAPDKEVQKA
jgi:hypothetical protein